MPRFSDVSFVQHEPGAPTHFENERSLGALPKLSRVQLRDLRAHEGELKEQTLRIICEREMSLLRKRHAEATQSNEQKRNAPPRREDDFDDDDEGLMRLLQNQFPPKPEDSEADIDSVNGLLQLLKTLKSRRQGRIDPNIE